MIRLRTLGSYELYCALTDTDISATYWALARAAGADKPASLAEVSAHLRAATGGQGVVETWTGFRVEAAG